MLHQTTLEQFKQLSEHSNRAVVSKEIYGDSLTPVRVFRALAADCADVALLDSSDHPTSADACIYIGIDPVAEFSSFGNKVQIKENSQEETLETDACQALR